MPYIKKDRRIELYTNYYETIDNAGELNFSITDIIITYIQRKGLNYQYINDVKGALQGALAEFDRQIVAPYEDSKIALNGDVYPALVHLLKETEGKY